MKSFLKWRTTIFLERGINFSVETNFFSGRHKPFFCGIKKCFSVKKKFFLYQKTYIEHPKILKES